MDSNLFQFDVIHYRLENVLDQSHTWVDGSSRGRSSNENTKGKCHSYNNGIQNNLCWSIIVNDVHVDANEQESSYNFH